MASTGLNVEYIMD